MQKRINFRILRHHDLLSEIDLRQEQESRNRIPFKYSKGENYYEIKRYNEKDSKG
jgi:hypothetical protein